MIILLLNEGKTFNNLPLTEGRAYRRKEVLERRKELWHRRKAIPGGGLN